MGRIFFFLFFFLKRKKKTNFTIETYMLAHWGPTKYYSATLPLFFVNKIKPSFSMEIKIYVILEEKNAGFNCPVFGLKQKKKRKSFTQLSTSSRCHVRVTLRTADPFPASLEPIWLDLADRLKDYLASCSSPLQKKKRKEEKNSQQQRRVRGGFFLSLIQAGETQKKHKYYSHSFDKCFSI